MRANGVERRTIEWNGEVVSVLDQTALPFVVTTLDISTSHEMVTAIRDMVVRGAPLIGAAVAYGIALAAAHNPDDDALLNAAAQLVAARPTAVNARWAAEQMTAAWQGVPRAERARRLREHAQAIADHDVACNRRLGSYGADALVQLTAGTAGGAGRSSQPGPASTRPNPDRPLSVLTHCNAGWLATVDWGTALAPVFELHRRGVAIHVWVDETRPRRQGLLTAWELSNEGIAHTLIADTAAASVIASGHVDAVIVGTDRTTANGDVVNKVGTYGVALAAADNNVPFLVVAPTSSVDLDLATGNDVDIEQRSRGELDRVRGRDDAGRVVDVSTLDEYTQVANPAFDVTPARLVTAIVTEHGVVTPGQLAAFVREHDSLWCMDTTSGTRPDHQVASTRTDQVRGTRDGG